MKPTKSIIADISEKTAEQTEARNKIIDKLYRNIIDCIVDTVEAKELKDQDLSLEIMLSALSVAWQVGRDNGIKAEAMSNIIKEFENKHKEMESGDPKPTKTIRPTASPLN